MVNYLISKLLILSTMAVFVVTDCPIGAHFPLGIAETHLSANQNEILKGLFEFDSSLQNNHRDLLVKIKYIVEFSPNKFTIRGNVADQTIDLIVNNVNLQVAGEAKIQSTNSNQLESRNVDILLNFDKVTFKARLVKGDDGNIKVELLDVNLALNNQAKQSMLRQLSAAWSEQDIQQLLQNLTKLIKDHLNGMVDWNAHKWVEVIPYGSQLLGGSTYSLLNKLSPPQVGNHSLILCYPQFGLHESSYFKGVEKPYGDLHKAEIIFNQESFNEYLDQLHKTEEIHDFEVSKAAVKKVLDKTREKFGPLKHAHNFGIKLFLSDKRFAEIQEDDDFPRSKITFTQDGNITLLMNIGAYMSIYNKEGHLTETLTLLIRFNAKIQVIDQNRWTYSKNKKRPGLSYHFLQVPSVQIYGEDGEVLNMESMFALIGMNQMINENLKTFDEDYEEALHQAQLLSYLGDIFLDGPKDFTGFHWLRMHAEAEDKKSISIVIDFEQEQIILDPERYESAYKYGFKEKFHLVRGRIHDPKFKIRVGQCNPLVFQAFEPFLGAWCREEIDSLNVTNKAEGQKRCLQAMCEIMYDFYAEKYVASCDQFEFRGIVYRKKETVRFILQVIAAIICIITMKILVKKQKKQKVE